MLRHTVIAVLASTLATGAAHAQTVRELFLMAPCSHDVSLQPGRGHTVVVDERNGYVRVADADPDYTAEHTFAVFRRADGTRLFACYQEERYEAGTISELSFFELGNGGMQEYQPPPVPMLDLEDFRTPGAPLPPRRYRTVALRYVLPREGTTVLVRPEPVEEFANEAHRVEPGYSATVADEQRYVRTVDTSYYRAIELNWDRTRGVFVVGRKIRR